MEKQLIDVLAELVSASKLITNETDLDATMHKYDMLFLGEKFNTINSLELRHVLATHFDIKISNEELNSFIPKICSSLNMKYTPMILLNDINNPKPHCYQIELW